MRMGRGVARLARYYSPRDCFSLVCLVCLVLVMIRLQIVGFKQYVHPCLSDPHPTLIH